MGRASLRTLKEHEAEIRQEIADRRAVGRDASDLGWLLRDVRAEMIEDFPCETCRGSGRIAVGPYGSRPPTTTCRDCNGSRVLTGAVPTKEEA